MASADSTAASAALAPNGATATPDPSVDGHDVPEVPCCISLRIDCGGSVESYRLFLARRTALEMLCDRGYSVPEDELARTLPEFRAWWAHKPELDRLDFSTTLASDISNKVKVMFCPPQAVNKATLLDVHNKTKEENLSRLILILQGKLMSQAQKSMKEIFTVKVDTFQIKELLVNITRHVLKPKHDVLTAEEKAKLLKEYNVVDSQLPCMLETDAVARYYGLDKGTVIKVSYGSELTRNHVTYRCIF